MDYCILLKITTFNTWSQSHCLLTVTSSLYPAVWITVSLPKIATLITESLFANFHVISVSCCMGYYVVTKDHHIKHVITESLFANFHIISASDGADLQLTFCYMLALNIITVSVKVTQDPNITITSISGGWVFCPSFVLFLINMCRFIQNKGNKVKAYNCMSEKKVICWLRN